MFAITVSAEDKHYLLNRDNFNVITFTVINEYCKGAVGHIAKVLRPIYYVVYRNVL